MRAKAKKRKKSQKRNRLQEIKNEIARSLNKMTKRQIREAVRFSGTRSSFKTTSIPPYPRPNSRDVGLREPRWKG